MVEYNKTEDTKRFSLKWILVKSHKIWLLNSNLKYINKNWHTKVLTKDVNVDLCGITIKEERIDSQITIQIFVSRFRLLKGLIRQRPIILYT